MMAFMLGQHKRAAVIAALVLIAVTGQTRVWSQIPDDRVGLANEVRQLHDARKSDAGIALAKQAVARAEQTFGVDHVETASWRDILAEAHRLDGDWKRAEDLFRASLKVREQSLDASHPDIAVSLRNLAIVNWHYGDKKREVEDYFLRSLAIYERSLGPTHPRVATLVHELGCLYNELGRADEATALYERVVAILEATPDTAEVTLATAINDLAVIHGFHKRYDQAALLHKRAHMIYARVLGPSHPHVATSLNNLAEQYRAQQRFAEARPLYEAAIAIYELALGPHHTTVTRSMANLAESYDAQGLTHESAKVLERVQAIRQETFKETGVPHGLVTRHLWDLSLPVQVLGLYAQAEGLYRAEFHAMRYVSIMNGNALQTRRKGDGQRFAFLEFVKIAWDLAKYGRDNTKLDETFRTVQMAYGSDAAHALAMMAARPKDNATLIALVRERQDLAAQHEKERGAMDREPGRSWERRDGIEKKIKEIDAQLKEKFPEYASLTRVQPLSVTEVQDFLKENEALILNSVTSPLGRLEEETFTWVVTKTDARWLRSGLGTVALAREVSALRCGLDAALWETRDDANRCRELVAAEPKRDAAGDIALETLPFDATRAHALYKALFGEAEGLLHGKHILLVPTGPLTQLPLHALVTAAPREGANKKSIAWLARSNAITVLPTVSSLNTLRSVAKPSSAGKAMISFGNPLLEGNPAERPWEARWAAVARERETCQERPRARVAQAAKARSVASVANNAGRADVAEIRSLMPLPDTADEVCAIAKDLKLVPDDIWLGARATETNIKSLNAAGVLAQYRIVHFATHGVVAGEVSGNSEPGLILTPPKEATDADDGYLSASEVAALKLDADWVILSACNTASGGASGAEELSGLGQAFIYAGARALLVSHWAVDSAATVKLVTSAVTRIGREKTLGRSEALRRAMLDMIDRGSPTEAHPASWAPFVVVGEGALR